MSVYISKTSWIDSFCQKHGRTILYHNHAITPDQCVCLGIVGYFQRGLNGKSKTRSARYSSMTLCRPQHLRRQKLYAQNLYCGNSGSLQNHFWFVIYRFLLVWSFLQILHWENGHKRSVFHFCTTSGHSHHRFVSISTGKATVGRCFQRPGPFDELVFTFWWSGNKYVSWRTCTWNISLCPETGGKNDKPRMHWETAGRGPAPFCFYFDLWSFSSCRIMRVCELICRSTWCDSNSWVTETAVQVSFFCSFQIMFDLYRPDFG